MTCSGCARQVTTAIQSVPGIASAVVSLEEKLATVRWAADAPADEPAVVAAVRKAGFSAVALHAASPSTAHARHGRWQGHLLPAVIPTALLMIGEWVLRLSETPAFHWIAFALAAIVQFGPGREFYRGAWRQFRAGSSNMDTLVALGSTTAFGYSAAALLLGVSEHLYFMESAAIITLVSVGHWLEARVSAHASSALKALMNLAPSLARRRNADGTETDTPVAELKHQDRIALRPGDRIPTDGEAVEGASAVDESMLTGEAVPVEKTAGARLYAGTVNLNGRLLMRVTSLGEETALARIIAAVQRAQGSRANIQRLGDRISNVFVPAVVLVAALAACWWGFMPEAARQTHAWLGHFLWHTIPPASALAAAVITTAAVLIIACPCAMGLATPAAIMAGSNAAARRGILVRDGVALEKAGLVTTVLFDKTGTLTIGKPEVIDSRHVGTPAADAPTPDENLRLAASLAESSTHPLSQAVSRLHPDRLPLQDWEEVRGSGVQARWRGTELVRLGSLSWLRENGVRALETQSGPEDWSQQGSTVLGLAQGSSLLALFAVRDRLKPGALETVRQLQRQRLTVSMVTGDNPITAAAIAAQAGISVDRVFAGVRPEKKAELVQTLQQRGERVAFVGDGLNDAPALEQADLGIAVSSASDIAREAADLILLRADLAAVPEAIGLARATLRTIKQNLFWAFFYNAIGIPLAALGFMSPVLCAAAMGLSDLVVIGNALRLRRWKLPGSHLSHTR